MRREGARKSLEMPNTATSGHHSIKLRRIVIGKLDGATVAIVVAHEFEDIELLYSIVRLSEEGAKVIVDALPPGQQPTFTRGRTLRTSLRPAGSSLLSPWWFWKRGNAMWFAQ